MFYIFADTNTFIYYYISSFYEHPGVDGSRFRTLVNTNPSQVRKSNMLVINDMRNKMIHRIYACERENRKFEIQLVAR